MKYSRQLYSGAFPVFVGCLILVFSSMLTTAEAKSENECSEVMKLYAKEIRQPAQQLSKQCADNPYSNSYWSCMKESMLHEHTFVNSTKHCLRENK